MKDLGEEERMQPRVLLNNSPMGLKDELRVSGDLECSFTMVSFIWSVERKISISISDICGDSESEYESGGLG